jgi:hypothetical protein
MKNGVLRSAIMLCSIGAAITVGALAYSFEDGFGSLGWVVAGATTTALGVILAAVTLLLQWIARRPRRGR